MLRAVLRSICLLLLLLLSGAPAWAHASLISSDPTDGAMIAATPSRIVLTFNEPVAARVLRLFDPSGATTDLTVAQQTDTSLVLLPPHLSAGTHLLSWRVISADGHPVGGAIAFSVERATARPGVRTDTPWSLAAAVLIARIMLYAGLCLGVGGAFFLTWMPVGAVARSRCGGIILTGLALVILVAVPSVVLQGLDSLGAPLSAALTAKVWRAGVDSTLTLTLALAVISALCGWLSLRSSPKALAALALVLAGTAFAVSGHAANAPPQWLTRPLVWLHVCGVALWIGSLVPLYVLLRGGDARPALVKFSRIIAVPLVLLLAAGVILVAIQIENLPALFGTAYGRVMAIKLGLVAMLLAVAACNRWSLTGRVVNDDPGAARTLARMVAMEILLAAAILATASVWRFTIPPRVLAQAEPAFVHLHGQSAMADVTVAPGRAGPVRISVKLMTEDFSPLPVREVTIAVENLSAGFAELRREARRDPDGTWIADGIAPVQGRWDIRIECLISDFEKIILDGPIVLQP